MPPESLPPMLYRVPEKAAWRAGYRAYATKRRNPYRDVKPGDAWRVRDLRKAWEAGYSRASADAKAQEVGGNVVEETSTVTDKGE